MKTYRYRCPDCSSPLDFDRLYTGRYLAKCRKCFLTHVARPDTMNYDEAYLKLLEDYDDGKVQTGLSRNEILEKEGILRSKEAVMKLIERSGLQLEDLPTPVSSALLSKTDFPVLYKKISCEKPKLGGTTKKLTINKALAEVLAAKGVDRLFKFQEDAVNSILQNHDVIIVAPTGSGKTEAFAIPVIQMVSEIGQRFGVLLMEERKIRALIIYPTKALSRDQLPKLKVFCDSAGIRLAIFDGDVSRHERNCILDDPPDIIMTNFDTLHYHLFHRTLFSGLLTTVKYVVVDEVHVYTGTFGSNIHFILKRLERLCGGFQAIAASATISNPKEFCEEIFGRSFTLVKENEGKHGTIHFTMMFPTLRGHRSLTLSLLQNLTKSGRKTIVFSNSHLAAELTAFYAHHEGVPIAVHRAGLLPSFRESIEERFRKGDLLAISSTPTLELGIDIGTIDAVISDMVTWTRLIQRIGRAGRRGQESIVFVSMNGKDAISQYYKNNPEDYFKDIEPGYIDSSNPVISKFQILAASLDKPIDEGEFTQFQNILKELVDSGLLSRRKGRLVPDYSAARKILRGYDIRGAGDNVSIIHKNRKIGERSMPQALDELHPDSVYFLGGVRYRCNRLIQSHDINRAELERLPNNYPYYTRPLKEEWPIIHNVNLKKKVMNLEVAYTDISIIRKVVGYINIELGSEVSKGRKVQLESPIEYSFRTKALIFKAPSPINLLNSISINADELLAASSFHATEHVTIEGTNMITGGAASDMGGVSLGDSGLIFIYDSSRGGNGATWLLYERFYEALKRGYSILDNCSCTTKDGCPRCTYSYRCGNNNEYLNRGGATEVIKRILDGEESKLDLVINPEWRPFV